MLTSAQAATLKAAIKGDANLAAFVASPNARAIADYMNGASASFVWRPAVPVSELNAVIDWTNTGFGALTVAKQNTYFAMTQGGVVDASQTSIRSGFGFVFGAGSATVTALTAVAQRPATRFEALFLSNNVAGVDAGGASLFGRACQIEDFADALWNPDGSVKP